MPKNKAVSDAASLMGKRSYKARLERLGLEKVQEIARENGKKGGRPPRPAAKKASREASEKSILQTAEQPVLVRSSDARRHGPR